MTAPTATHPGTLYVVATPIGNKDDLSFRAMETFKLVDAILAEDTRHSQALLTSVGIKKPLISLHTHNESDKSVVLIQQLLQGKQFALISDAGTPLISDPGFPLVRMARAHDIAVIPIPGPCALITALSASGVACDTFTFAGFLPAKSHARCEKLTSFLSLGHTLVVYESTHRIYESLIDIGQVFGETHEFVLAKELTKTFERFVTGTTQVIQTWLAEDDAHMKGEFVLIIPPRAIQVEEHHHDKILKVLLDQLPLKQVVKIACELTGDSKNSLYQRALLLQNQDKT